MSTDNSSNAQLLMSGVSDTLPELMGGKILKR